MNYWNLLPREISLMILSFVPPSTLLSLGQVSRRMLCLTRDPALWRNVVVKTGNIGLKWNSYRKLVERATMACSFTMEDNRKMKQRPLNRRTRVIMEILVGGLPGKILTILSICGSLKVDQKLLSLVGNFINLKSLTFFSEGRLAYDLLFSKLRRLEYVKSDHFSDNDVISLATNNHHLTHLVLVSSNSGLTDSSLQVLSRHCRNLAQLHLPLCDHVTNVGLAAVALNCPKLVSLDLSGSQVTDEGVSLLADRCGAGLTRLSLNYCKSITDWSVMRVARKSPELKLLHLRVGTLTDNALDVIGTCCPLLTELNIGGNWEISARSVVEIFQKCQIERLGIQNTEIGMKYIRKFSQCIFIF